MLGYGRDESAPTPGGMFATHFVGVLCVFRWWTLHYCNPSAMLLQCVQNTFTECSQRVRYLCVTYSPCKSMVFAMQKGGFYFLASALLQCCDILAAFYSVYFSVAITILVFPRCVRFVCLCCQKPVAFVPFVPFQFCLLFVPHGQ